MQPKENYHGHHNRKPHHQGRRLDGRRLCHAPGQCPDHADPEHQQVARGRARLPDRQQAHGLRDRSRLAPHLPAFGDYRIVNKRTGFEIGAGWHRISQRSGEEYLSVKLEAPEIGVIFGNLAPAPGGEENKKVILWNNPQ
ncbi:hypothetical protein X739_31635 [Mesorhizobium sp. LNHC220B00]|nr:hypothetical protein X739_31635 [Mesorhizobium sp. LNHC220B00]